MVGQQLDKEKKEVLEKIRQKKEAGARGQTAHPVFFDPLFLGQTPKGKMEVKPSFWGWEKRVPEKGGCFENAGASTFHGLLNRPKHPKHPNLGRPAASCFFQNALCGWFQGTPWPRLVCSLVLCPFQRFWRVLFQNQQMNLLQVKDWPRRALACLCPNQRQQVCVHVK